MNGHYLPLSAIIGRGVGGEGVILLEPAGVDDPEEIPSQLALARL
jgi:hypothetical protein